MLGLPRLGDLLLMTADQDDFPDGVIDASVLDRYLAHEATEAERAQVERVLAARPEQHDIVEALRRVTYVAGVDVPAVDVDREWERVHARVAPVARQKSVTRRTPAVGHARFDMTMMTARQQPWALVAIVTLVLVVGVAVGVLATMLRTQFAETPALVTYATAPGQRASIELADGTRAILNVGSQLRIPEDFRMGHRTVYLRGEAYFQVMHAGESPFTVDAGDVHTTVLGTEFGVRAYSDTNVRVAVRSGRVAVNHVVADSHDIVHVARDGRITIAHEQSLDAALGFVSDRLVLQDVPLRDAIPDLDRWYDVDITLGDDALGDLPIHAMLRSGAVGDLMDVLQLTFGARVVRDGRRLTLYRNHS